MEDSRIAELYWQKNADAISATRPQMSMIDRAAQFSPFAALTGYDAGTKIPLDEILDMESELFRSLG